jgi:hypothetical protein
MVCAVLVRKSSLVKGNENRLKPIFIRHTFVKNLPLAGFLQRSAQMLAYSHLTGLLKTGFRRFCETILFKNAPNITSADAMHNWF